MIVGNARVSTDGQSVDAQQAALTAAGAEKVFAEKISGAVTDRKALARAIAALGPGDVLLVTRLDRLARSTRDLLNVLDAVGKAGAGFRSLADNWADTTTPHGRLMVTVLGGLAEFERELIKARTAEGRHRAKARGVRFGRKLKLSRHQILEPWREGKPGKPWLKSAGPSGSAIQPSPGCAIGCRGTVLRRVADDKVSALLRWNPAHAKGFYRVSTGSLGRDGSG